MKENFSSETKLAKNILKEEIKNKQLLLDYSFSTIIFLGSLAFLLVGISSFLKINLVYFLNSDKIIFFPQGITMSFYGTLGLIISISQFLILYWKVGEGYNEFNKEKGIVEIFRRGYPGKNSEIKLVYEIKDILRINSIYK